MNNMSPSVQSLLQRIAEYERRLKALDYTRVDFCHIKIDEQGDVFYVFKLDDDFQSHKFYSGGIGTGYDVEVNEEWMQSAWSREERELRYLLAQQGEGLEYAKQLVSAAGRSYAKRLQEEQSKWARLVYDPKVRGLSAEGNYNDAFDG